VSRLFPRQQTYILFITVGVILGIAGCEKKQDSIIESVSSIPSLQNAYFSASVINTDTINVGSEHKPDDILTISGVATVRIFHTGVVDPLEAVNYAVQYSESSDVLTSGTLLDNGSSPDVRAQDSVYSAKVTVKITRSDIGKYYIVLWATNESGNMSSSLYLPFTVVRYNRPPILSNLRMDTVVSIGTSTDTLQLSVTASDLDGQNDIVKVFFNSYKPNGAASSGNPFLMYDDGGSIHDDGDAVDGDGIYSLRIILPPTTERGSYRFEFHALDRSNDPSNTIIQRITIN
jgi:hypothetical protein